MTTIPVPGTLRTVRHGTCVWDTPRDITGECHLIGCIPSGAITLVITVKKLPVLQYGDNTPTYGAFVLCGQLCGWIDSLQQ